MVKKVVALLFVCEEWYSMKFHFAEVDPDFDILPSRRRAITSGGERSKPLKKNFDMNIYNTFFLAKTHNIRLIGFKYDKSKYFHIFKGAYAPL